MSLTTSLIGNVRRVVHVVLALILLAGAISANADDRPASVKPPRIIAAGNKDDIQHILDTAPNNAIIQCNRNRALTLTSSLRIRKPLSVQGLYAQLPAKLGNTPLVIVESEDVSFTDFELRGNADTVDQIVRVPLLEIRAGNFRVERGLFLNSSKDGVCIDGAAVPDKDIVNGVVRDIVGRGVVRDVVSISGGGQHGHRIRHVLVDNVQGYDSQLRGAVEVSDGTADITVRNVYAEKCVYAVDVQDHSDPRQINTNVLLDGITAVDSTHVVRTANKPIGHSRLTIRNIVGERCTHSLKLSNTQDITVENVVIVDHPHGNPPISIMNCDGVYVRNIAIRNSAHKGPGLLLEDCSEVTIDALRIQGDPSTLTNAVVYRIGAERPFAGLRIHNVFAPATKGAGIVLEKTTGNVALTDVLISGNLTTVQDGIKGQRTHIDRNY